MLCRSDVPEYPGSGQLFFRYRRYLSGFFIKLWEKRANFKIESNVKAYLSAALKHHILNTIKERQIRLKYQKASG